MGMQIIYNKLSGIWRCVENGRLFHKFSPTDKQTVLCLRRDGGVKKEPPRRKGEGTRIFSENVIMKGSNTRKAIRACVMVVFGAGAISMMLVPKTAMGKSLYVIADIHASDPGNTEPVQAYDIGVDGTLSFQARHDIPYSMLGAVGMAIDSDSGYLFITYEHSGDIRLVNATTMTDAGTTTAPDATDLAGIVYDPKKKLLYTVDRRDSLLYVYNWDAKTATLTHMEGSPFTLTSASGYGIALDDVNGLLYVANGTDTVTVYRTSDWKLVNTIKLNRIAISIAVDVRNGFVYTGAGYAGNMYLTQYHLPTGIKREVQVEPDAGVMGLGVDQDTGLVYMTTGMNNAPGGDNLLVYDAALKRIDIVPDIGNPTGLAIADEGMGYNPLNLKKTILRGASGTTALDGAQYVGPGDTITYGIHLNNDKDFTATDVSIFDILPDGVTFVSANNAGGTGLYNSKTRTYEWSYSSVSPGSSLDPELTVQVRRDVQIGTTIRNSVTLTSNETPRTTMGVSVVTMNNALNLTKSIVEDGNDPVKGVDANKPITYTICFDNNDNDFPVTDVSVVDILPDEVTFVAADKEDNASGAYDPVAHTYTWSYPFVKPGASVCLGLVVHVNPDVPPGTTITNSAIIDSNETPPATASVDAVTYMSPLTFSNSISGAVEGTPQWINPGDKVTYTLRFQNKNSSDLNHVTIVDTLPKEVTFVRARTDDVGVYGRYDAKSHTYTWTYISLPPAKSSTSLDLVVQVNKDVAPGTTITNSATIDSDETPPTTARVDAMTYYKSLNLSKTVVGSVIGEVEYVDANETVEYNICFENSNDSTITNVSVLDTLPKDLSFVSADDDGVFGKYDSKAHTYAWSYPSVAPGTSKCLTLIARVKPGLSASKTMTNFVAINSDETAPETASTDVVMGEGSLQVQSLRIVPDVIRRGGGTYDVQAVALLPPGIGKDDIKDTLPTLYPGRVRAKRQIVYGTATTSKVIALFDKADLIAAIPQNGQVTLKVAGKLKDGRSFYGEATVRISGSN
jgi:uncharacterized repeat protein (TIGR01451 family)